MAERRGLVRRWVFLLLPALFLPLVVFATLTAFERALGPVPLGKLDENSRLVLDREGRLLRAFTTVEDRWRLPVVLEDVDPRFLDMLLAYEDKRFRSHGGVDFRAMARAAWQFVREGELVSGASTITMQLGRLLDDLETRSFTDKAVQIIRARQLERQMSKREILQAYLTLAPYGGNIEGVRAASLAYFGKEPDRLALHEAALLVALPQSPETRRPDRHPQTARRARDRVLDRVARDGVITRAQARWAKSQPVPDARQSFPMLAAHLSERMLARHSGRDVLRLSLDKTLQAGVERAVAQAAQRLGPKISAAALVVDHTTGKVRAHVGSPGYLDAARRGAIDMTRAVRSPGSALKPFIYGLAFEAGLAHPQTLIEDRPTRFSRYAPRNFDSDYKGTVTVAEALQLSLNVPAVKMLAAVGPARLAARLRHAGFSISVPRNLAIALGGIGLRLDQLTALYAGLARGGEPVALGYLAEQGGVGHERAAILSPVAAWYVSDILRGAPPPRHAKGGRIAFKTGTSYGHRDAWSAGSRGRYTVAVWVGRADGTATPGLTGRAAAAPLLFDIFAMLDGAAKPAEPPRGALIAKTRDLPMRLRYFDARLRQAAAGRSVTAPPVRIAFPPDGAELALQKLPSGAPAPLPFKAEGGALPLTWLVEGRPVQGRAGRRQLLWEPDGRGFVEIVVVDAKGRRDRVQARIR
ncbi:penicillin-binding protein 1C [Dichotomicrobium thermohalophilum]|uniref:peptidoglycan glycosyltransferase n=1 Tax=Dichotomicrobium thermohalophilum TaxID=933063 RepID=A0A397QE52_9HYPH|nr:penicillin-binding protein 1C [Dichotomicrobium thermohalophilum]RIA56354.1 penicillin-binding protein 1C [Dichotomicrobium thermohalophilum]